MLPLILTVACILPGFSNGSWVAVELDDGNRAWTLDVSCGVNRQCFALFVEHFAAQPWCHRPGPFVARRPGCVEAGEFVDGWEVMVGSEAQRGYVDFVIGPAETVFTFDEQTLGVLPCPIFADGFETGNASRWSKRVP